MVNVLRHAEAIVPVVQFSPTVTTKIVATSSVTITKLKLISTGGSAHVSVYDNSNGIAKNLKWVLDSSLQTNDTDDFVNPLKFDNGIFLVCDDGTGFSPQVCVAFIP